MINLTPLATLLLLLYSASRSLSWPAVARWAWCAPPPRWASRDCGLYYECAGTSPVLMQCPPASTGTSGDRLQLARGQRLLHGLREGVGARHGGRPLLQPGGGAQQQPGHALGRALLRSTPPWLCYPEQCNDWLQTSNPASEVEVTGFRATCLAFSANSYDDAWAVGGAGRESL